MCCWSEKGLRIRLPCAELTCQAGLRLAGVVASQELLSDSVPNVMCQHMRAGHFQVS